MMRFPRLLLVVAAAWLALGMKPIQTQSPSAGSAVSAAFAIGPG
jgi:hypothetical protein